MAVAAAFDGSADSFTANRDRGPWLLTSLPSIGSISWRCAGGQGLAPGAYALGFHAFASSATDEVMLSAGGRIRISRTVQPGEALAFPHLPIAVQRVTVVQGTEPRTLHATVTVNFQAQSGLSYCWPYLPPPVTVRVEYARPR